MTSCGTNLFPNFSSPVKELRQHMITNVISVDVVVVVNVAVDVAYVTIIQNSKSYNDFPQSDNYASSYKYKSDINLMSNLYF